LTGNDADAADALQETLIAIVRGLDRFDGRAAFTTWSYRVATNATLDELRRRRRRPTPGLPGDDGGGRAGGGSGPGWSGNRRPAGGPVAAGFAGPVAPEPTIDGAVADRLDVDAALAQLPEDFRAAVVLRDLCDLEYTEIGAILAIPPGTVRSRIARGRGLLADLLGNRTAPPDRPTTAP
jgi:RNA polymerase sigma-70 factor (ECF subfamily)